MPKLIVNPGSPDAWEIQLQPGANRLGRNPANDFTVNDPSVSSTHCDVVVEGNSVLIRDLDSTNGTFVSGSQIQETRIENGQTVHLGNVEMLFQAAAPGPMRVTVSRPAPLRPAILATSLPSPPPADPAAEAVSETEPVLAARDAGPRFCKFHPKTAARNLCPQCNRSFCDVCVIKLNTGGTIKKNCRTCGVECVPLLVQNLATATSKGFFARLPGAFAYPLRGAGAFIVVVGIVLFGLLRLGGSCFQYATHNEAGIGSRIRMLIFGVVMLVWAGGYLFTFLQSILHSTAAEDRELPDLPGMDNVLEDILLPFARLMGLVLFCFGPYVVLLIFTPQITALPALLALLAGCFYFPMAFLAVAILDTVTSLNPLVVIPSICKAPLEYLVSLIPFAAVSAFRVLGTAAVGALFPEGLSTHSMGALFGMLGSYALLSFVALYLLIVAIHVLGLIYVTKQDRLAWHRR